MAKLSMVREEDAPNAAKRIYEEIRDVKHLRFVPNFFKTLAHNQPALEGTWSVYRNVSTRGSIPEALKEMIFVAISAAKKCSYCEAAHLAFCRILKVDPETCNNLVNNLDAIRPERTREILLFSVKVGTDPQRLTDADYAALKRHKVDNSEIIEIVAMCAFAVYAITIADALQLEKDKW